MCVTQHARLVNVITLSSSPFLYLCEENVKSSTCQRFCWRSHWRTQVYKACYWLITPHHSNDSLCRLLPLGVCRKYCRKCMWTGGTDALLKWCVHRLLNSHIADFISRLEWLHTLICLSFLQKEGWVTPHLFSFSCEMILFFFFAVKVVERPLNMTSFWIPASFTGTGWSSNFSIVIFFLLFCRYQSTKFRPVVKAIKISVACQSNNLCSCSSLSRI